MTQTENTTAVAVWEPNQQELDIYRKYYAPQNTTQEEWEIFLETCRTYRISPLRKQIYLVGRWDSVKKRMVNTPQISIGTLRLMALRTKEFEGTTEPEWGDEEGNWYKLWPKRFGPYPYAARIGVYRRGFRAPVWGVAYFHELSQTKKDGGLTKFWSDMGIHMILKCALADAIRGAFEEECGGIYIHDEMNQADADTTVITIIPEVDTSDASTDPALIETAKVRQQPTTAQSTSASQQKSTAKPTQQFTKVEPTKSTQPEVQTEEKIPTSRELRAMCAAMEIDWDKALEEAFEVQIKSGKVTLQALKANESNLPPAYCKALVSWINKQPAQVA